MNNDSYFVTVTFERFLSEDLEIAQDRYPGLAPEKALRLQLRDELQEGCDNGMAGLFTIGSISLPDGVAA